MLKITYTEIGLQMEQLHQSVEALVSQRVVLSLRTGQSVAVSTSTASFLVSTALPQVAILQAIATRLGADVLSLAIGDSEFTEVCLQGHWIAQDQGHSEGVLATELPPEVEMLIFQLWQASQSRLLPSPASFR